MAVLLFSAPSSAAVVRNISYDVADVSVVGDTILFAEKFFEPFSVTTENETIVLSITFPGVFTLTDDDAAASYTRIIGAIFSSTSVFLGTSQRSVTFPELVGYDHTEGGFDGGTLGFGSNLPVPAWTGAILTFSTLTLSTAATIDATYLPVLFDQLSLQMRADSTVFTPVPLPPAAWLLGGTLAACGALGRRRAKSAI